MNLLQLCYYSVPNLSSDADIDQILETSKKNNRRDGLTGAMLLGDGYFLQVLEGSRTRVTACLSRILADPRHTSPVLIGAQPMIERAFLGWEMNLIRRDAITNHIIMRYMATATIAPETFSFDAAIKMLREMCS